jgi:secreted PhoX family phosphatase
MPDRATTVPDRPTELRLLPMTGLTHGKRSPITCHLRCGDACAFEAPNTTETSYFRDVAALALSRRAVVGAGATAAGVALAAGVLPAPAAALQERRSGRGEGSGHHHDTGLTFTAIAPVATTVDDVTVPAGYQWEPIIRWGDPLFADAPGFDAAAQSPEAQSRQFGYNNDYLDIIETNRGGTRALLVCNHEYTNENIMFPPGFDPERVIRTAWAAHGMSVVELRRRRRGDTWQYERAGRLNRRITLDTPFTLDGPAAGSALLKTVEDQTGREVRGTMNNCSGGTTPWGTVLSGEENFNQYFKATGIDPKETRYGLSGSQDTRNWRSVDPRWDATQPAYANEPNRFGWVVEIDPYDPTSTPRKHTAMGRFKHEGANVIVSEDGHVVAYMGDDERFDYLYRFVSRKKFKPGGRPGDRRHNLDLLSEGDLSVARFTGDGLADGISDGTGEWLPLTVDGVSVVPGFTTEQVLVYTRLAADAVQPTKMDRPEDVQPSLQNSRLYVVCTNNTDRGKLGKEGPTEPNPRAANKDGHIVEMTPTGGDHTASTFAWNLLLICGDPATAGTYFGGYTGPVSPISCPDNVAFDSRGNLWVATDGQPSALSHSDGLYKVPVAGPERGRVQQFLAVPAGAETCGPVIHDREGSVFVAVQHPGEEGSWASPQSRFPDFVAPGATAPPDDFAGPRPTVVQVTRH